MLLLFCLIQVSTTVKDAKPSVGAFPGSLSPELRVMDREGVERSLKDFSGKRVFLNFWAAYDGPSRERNIRFSQVLNQDELCPAAYLSVSIDFSFSVFEETVALDRLSSKQQFVCQPDRRDVLMKQFKLAKGWHNFLIDEKGVIVAMNLSPEEVKQALQVN